MLIPSSFKETRQEVLLDFIEKYPLASLISQSEQAIKADHIPVVVHTPKTGNTWLEAHINKANSLWQDCQTEKEVLAIFQGPNAYISPNWYPSKLQTAKAAPTWNYAVVHLRGRIEFVHDNKWIRRHLEELSQQHEQHQQNPWKLEDAPQTYINSLLEAVVGLKIHTTSIIGQFKLSQNKSPGDFAGVIDGLEASNQAYGQEVARMMRERI